MPVECPGDILKVLCAIFIPPVGVFLEVGCNMDLLINVILTLLFFFPGLLHALYVIYRS